MKITINDIELASGITEAPQDFKIRGTKELQISPLLRAKNVKVLDRGNMKTIVTFKVVRRHKSIQDAIEFVLEHASALSDVFGKAIFGNHVMDNSSVKIAEAFAKGTASHHSYEVIGGGLRAE